MDFMTLKLYCSNTMVLQPVVLLWSVYWV